MICQSTAQQKKKNEKNRLVCVPCPYLRSCILLIPGIEPVTSPLQMLCLSITVLAISDEQLSGMALISCSEFFSPKKIQTQFSVCCGMLRNASKPPPTGPQIRCCGVLRPASTVGARSKVVHVVKWFTNCVPCLRTYYTLTMHECIGVHHYVTTLPRTPVRSK